MLGVVVFAFLLPREKDPEINFNWIDITTILPGASAEDVERKVTDPIEDALSRVADIKFVLSTSRDSLSRMLVRFEELDERTFDKRVAALRREIQAVENNELPEEATSPYIFEITSSNGLPIATIAAIGEGADDHFRYATRQLQDDIEQIKGTDIVNMIGEYQPEVHIVIDRDKSVMAGVSASQIADTVRSYIYDVAPGVALLWQREWLLRIQGASDLPQLSNLRIIGTMKDVRISDVANVVRNYEDSAEFAQVHGKPAVVYTITKKANVNTLDLVARIQEFIDEKNSLEATTGLKFELIDDQTTPTRNALNVMQTNAAVGLALVMFVTWLFLGFKVALLTSLGIPFTLAGTFIVLHLTGQTLNNSVLLAIVILFLLGSKVGFMINAIFEMYKAFFGQLRVK